ncbi:unnamed protein product [Zymoseptoria tritici ST99CH_1E4]|uniref:F-box domain-containing protein n=1 Tax=Zymoseptoria tritici ST99CH_1E4 TaxID=1276532 RepID=A0A2H1GAQ3_ZYMTR|nr:unnamed protein product [Zymoseptoria tritici ST99CH_1E4]
MATPLPLGDALAPPSPPLAAASLSETNSNPASKRMLDEMNGSELKAVGIDNHDGPGKAKVKAHILAIPQEMRDEIYGYLFTDTIADISETVGEGAVRNSGILFSCKQLRAEATKPFYDLSTFYGATANCIVSLAKRLSDIPLYKRGIIKEVRWGVQGGPLPHQCDLLDLTYGDADWILTGRFPFVGEFEDLWGRLGSFEVFPRHVILVEYQKVGWPVVARQKTWFPMFFFELSAKARRGMIESAQREKKAEIPRWVSALNQSA